MANHTANWEDEENNRIVQLSVDYQVTDSQVQIEEITPTSVLFFDAANGQPQRRIGVWTERGRQMLRRQYRERVGLDSLREQLESSLLATSR